jgi:hypothetical protein
VRRQLLDAFPPGQIVELVLRFVHHSGNKPSIALGFDSAVDETRLTPFHYDGRGDYVVERGEEVA